MVIKKILLILMLVLSVNETFSAVSYFSFSKRANLPNGSVLNWNYKLKSSGRFEWRAPHNLKFWDMCGEYGGHMVTILSKQDKESFFSLVEKTTGPYKKKSKNERRRRDQSNNSVTYKLNGKIRKIRNLKLNGVIENELFSKINTIIKNSYKTEKNRALILKMRAYQSDKFIKIDFINEGNLDLKLNIPEENKDILSIRSKGKIFPLLIHDQHEAGIRTIKKKSIITIAFNFSNNMDISTSRIYFLNKAPKQSVISICGVVK